MFTVNAAGVPSCGTITPGLPRITIKVAGGVVELEPPPQAVMASATETRQRPEIERSEQ
jgi:hypothetical protein